MTPRDFAELVRAPAALSVPGDAIAGATAAGTLSAATAGIAAASVCLYLGGMAANDWADRELDAVERPERPIPSGRVSPQTALKVAGGLTAAGVALAGLAGGRKTFALATGLAAAVWAYDMRWKNTAAGPAGMALCRGLDVLMGASTGRVRDAIRPAAVVAAHTYAVTALSRKEVHGAPKTLPMATLAATGLVTAVAAQAPRADRTSGLLSWVNAGLAAWYATRFGKAQRRAFTEPSAGNVRKAVGAGITSLPALQGALIARSGKPVTGAAVAVAAPLGAKLAKAVSAT